MNLESRNPREQALELLKGQLSENALNLSGLYLRGAVEGNRDVGELAKSIQPGTYNENNGTVIFATTEGVYAIPSNSHLKDLLTQAEFQNDKSIGVPWLNDGNMWGTEAERLSNSGFQDWKRLHGQS
jgi:UDP-N-acetyl-D-mannosaminuronic acid transferase (WecB/TagA/CpsF family)